MNDIVISKNTSSNLRIQDSEEKNIIIEENAVLNLNEIYTPNNMNVTVLENAEFNLFLLDLTETESINVNVNLVGENSKATLNLRTYLDKKLTKEFNIKINHMNKNTKSNVINYGIVNDSSSVSMNVISRIDKGNSKSVCKQNTKVISLSESGHAELNPILEIKEFDVEGSHGATFSKITEDEIYYLQSRGFTKEQAKKIITVNTLMAGTNLEIENIIIRRIDYGTI